MSKIFDFNLASFDAADRGDAISDYFRDRYDLFVHQNAIDGFHFQSGGLRFGSVIAAYGEKSSSTIRATHLVGKQRPLLIVKHISDGALTMMTEDGVTTCSKGDVVIFEPGAVKLMTSRWLKHESIALAQEEIDFQPALHPTFCVLRARDPLGSIIALNLRFLIDKPSGFSHASTKEIGETLKSLITGVLRQLVGRKIDRNAMHIAIEQAARMYILDNIRKPNLSAAEISHAIGVSRSSLYRLFEEDGGVQKHISTTRLVLAHASLASELGGRGQVGQVAAEFCFADQFAFSKAFRREFGVSPKDIQACVGFDASNGDTNEASDLSLKNLLR